MFTMTLNEERLHLDVEYYKQVTKARATREKEDDMPLRQLQERLYKEACKRKPWTFDDDMRRLNIAVSLSNQGATLWQHAWHPGSSTRERISLPEYWHERIGIDLYTATTNPTILAA